MSVNFRQKAKEKLFTSEELSGTVARAPAHWRLAVAAGVMVVAAFIVWTFCGRVPLTEEGTGVYLKDSNEVLCFVKLENAAEIGTDMQVSVRAEGNLSDSISGYIVKEESRWISTEELLSYLNGNEELLQYLTDGEAVAVYHCALDEEAADMLKDGETIEVEIQKDSIHPIELWL